MARGGFLRVPPKSRLWFVQAAAPRRVTMGVQPSECAGGRSRSERTFDRPQPRP